MTLKKSENLFRDLLGAPDHAEMKAKHDAAAHIRRHMTAGSHSQARFAEICGLTQPQVSNIVNFKLRDFSIDRLNAVLARIDDSARIEVVPVFKVGV